MKKQPKIFLARAGARGEAEETALDLGLAIIDFRAFPSLEGAESFDAILELVTNARPGLNPHTATNWARQLSAFSLGMQDGDIIVLPRKLTSQIALGEVTGPYDYRKVGGEFRHTRPVKWLRPEIPRAAFAQDLLYSFGAFMTVCRISRNDAEQRVLAVLAGKSDPGFTEVDSGRGKMAVPPEEIEAAIRADHAQAAHDQIVAHIQSRFSGHSLARLVEAVLKADGWMTSISPPGPDAGVDILAGRGSLGLDHPRLCVQVKSQATPADVTVFRALQGTMQTFKAEQGLLVCWGGFTKAVRVEAKQGYFSVRLWESGDLVEAIFRNYELLPAEIQAELPLKKVWMLVMEESDE